MDRLVVDGAAPPSDQPGVRWVWADTAATYPAVVAAGGRLARCHDLALTEALLLGHVGRWGEPRSLAAAWARLHGLPVPLDPPPEDPDAPADLFGTQLWPTGPGGADTAGPAAPDPRTVLGEVYADQRRRIAATAHPARFGLLVAAESAGALAAVELTATGLPWDAATHHETLVGLLGPRPPTGVRPTRLAELGAAIDAAFGRAVNPDSPAGILEAFAATGRTLSSTRSWVLREVDHPAVPLLLEYKKLARVLAANGWAWQERWATGGRFRPGFVPGAVVSGRWATRGGGGLQLPKVVRRAVRAEPGRRLVVADAGQLEPRLLAALSGDPGMLAAARADDLYADIATRWFGGDRSRAKVGLLGAMYGQVGGQAAAPLAVLERRYPLALRLLEQAARAGEQGEMVHSHLGRGSSSAPDDWAPTPAAARARGRFTRNFVVQATAAEWALVWLALIRSGLPAVPEAELVFFVHDEVVLHVPDYAVAAVEDLVRAAATEAGRLLFGPGGGSFPLDVHTVACYADA